jgi:hypothetical protein
MGLSGDLSPDRVQYRRICVCQRRIFCGLIRDHCAFRQQSKKRNDPQPRCLLFLAVHAIIRSPTRVLDGELLVPHKRMIDCARRSGPGPINNRSQCCVELWRALVAPSSASASCDFPFSGRRALFSTPIGQLSFRHQPLAVIACV